MQPFSSFCARAMCNLKPCSGPATVIQVPVVSSVQEASGAFCIPLGSPQHPDLLILSCIILILSYPRDITSRRIRCRTMLNLTAHLQCHQHLLIFLLAQRQSISLMQDHIEIHHLEFGKRLASRILPKTGHPISRKSY
jgi:hypothetical protein